MHALGICVTEDWYVHRKSSGQGTDVLPFYHNLQLGALFPGVKKTPDHRLVLPGTILLTVCKLDCVSIPECQPLCYCLSYRGLFMVFLSVAMKNKMRQK